MYNTSKNALGSPPGRAGSAKPRLRGPAAFVIVETTGAEGIKPSLTVGNGLCAVPLRGNYNLCGQPEPPTEYVIPSERSESRNLPEWQILHCVGTFCHVVDSSTPLALRSE